MSALKTLGLRHIALWVHAYEETRLFYRDILHMDIEWEPDEDNVYLTSGHDNLALHRLPQNTPKPPHGALDHIGFILQTPEAVSQWYQYMKENHVDIKNTPRKHRDGAVSFYCYDPDGNTVQMIYHPPISERLP